MDLAATTVRLVLFVHANSTCERAFGQTGPNGPWPMTISLLCKWLFKLLNEEGIWQELLKNKYLGSKTISRVQWNPGDSYFWAGLMRVKQHLFHFSTFTIKDGTQTIFWEDTWLGNSPLCDQYPSLYNIVRHE